MTIHQGHPQAPRNGKAALLVNLEQVAGNSSLAEKVVLHELRHIERGTGPSWESEQAAERYEVESHRRLVARRIGPRLEKAARTVAKRRREWLDLCRELSH